MRFFAATTLTVGMFFLGPVQSSYAGDTAGADVYRSKCSICHATDGSGNTSLGKKNKIKDLRLPETQKATDAEWFELISKGKKPMPGNAEKLTEEQMRQVIAYIRELGKKK